MFCRSALREQGQVTLSQVRSRSGCCARRPRSSLRSNAADRTSAGAIVAPIRHSAKKETTTPAGRSAERPCACRRGARRRQWIKSTIPPVRNVRARERRRLPSTAVRNSRRPSSLRPRSSARPSRQSLELHPARGPAFARNRQKEFDKKNSTKRKVAAGAAGGALLARAGKSQRTG